MKKNIILAICTIILAIGITFGLEHYLKNNRSNFFQLEEGKSVPNFTFKTIDGNTHSLHDFSGQTILIHFWASWCAPCVVEFPDLIKMAENRNDVMIIALSSDRTAKAIDRFIKWDMPDNFKVVHDKPTINSTFFNFPKHISYHLTLNL